MSREMKPSPNRFCFFSSRRRHTRSDRDWSSDVCSSDLSIDRCEGAVLYDVDGNSYIDLLAGVGVASLGYAHPRYVAALQRQIERSEERRVGKEWRCGWGRGRGNRKRMGEGQVGSEAEDD